jgi:DNA-binding GntR family transcriptional regulator
MATDTVGAGAEGSRDPRRYRRIADDVRGLITSGQTAHGQPAPSITELASKYGTARQTVAKGLCLLVEEGLLTLYPGCGYYVTGPNPE